MVGVLRLSPIEALGLTYRELVVMYDARMLDSWDHTSLLACMVNNLQSTVQNLVGGSKIKPKSPTEFHPYRKKSRKGLRIGGDISVLKALASALVSRR